MQLDHLTIRTRDLGAAKVFFEQVPDLSEGERPAIIRRIPGYWLFDGNRRPVVHLIGTTRGDAGHPAEAIMPVIGLLFIVSQENKPAPVARNA